VSCRFAHACGIGPHAGLVRMRKISRCHTYDPQREILHMRAYPACEQIRMTLKNALNGLHLTRSVHESALVGNTD
jgi:hypothetical protein